jgi:histone H3/H4
MARGKTADVVAAKKPRKPHRFRPGTRARRQVKKEQKRTDEILEKAPFRRLCRELAVEFRPEGLGFEKKALDLLQTYIEAWTIRRMRDGKRVAEYLNRKTLTPRDMALVRYFRDN